jgi:REP element-mobilizing transposase RayT
MSYYTGHNVRPAHDIHYSWTGWSSEEYFPATLPEGMLLHLAGALAKDNLQMESQVWRSDEVHLSVAAPPDAAPTWISQRVKGRVDHALRQHGVALSFSRKVSLRAFGHNRTTVVDKYVRDQLENVDLADPRYRQTLAAAAVNDPAVDLSAAVSSRHGQYWYGLHVVLVVARRHRIGQREFLAGLRDRGIQAARVRDCGVKRVAIMPDHMHVAVRGAPGLSPLEIALGIQEETAGVAGCRLWEDNFYVGTFGDYDCGAVGGSVGGVRRG